MFSGCNISQSLNYFAGRGEGKTGGGKSKDSTKTANIDHHRSN
jgi:hypothetical protein